MSSLKSMGDQEGTQGSGNQAAGTNDVARRVKESMDHAHDMVRKGDPQLYACLQHLPKHALAAALAVRAFGTELNHITYTSSDTSVSNIRLQWWHHTIQSIARGEPPGHPLAPALTAVIMRHKLKEHLFTSMIEAHLKIGNGIEDITELLAVAEGACSAPILLCLQAAGSTDGSSQRVASYVGKAMGLAWVIRAVPAMALKSKTALPKQALIHHQITDSELFSKNTRETGDERVTECVFHLATLAKGNLDQARNLAQTSRLEPSSKAVLLPAVATDRFLDRLQQYNFNIFHPQFAGPQPGGTGGGSAEPLLLWLSLFNHRVRGTF